MQSGLERATIPDESAPQNVEGNVKLPSGNRRRKLEIVDSEDEGGNSEDDYGWDEVDEANIPNPPPQTQGSEDVLLPGPEELEEEEEEQVGDEAVSNPGNLEHD